MTRIEDTCVWIVTGTLGSMALGMTLFPLRGLVAASNLAFAFMALTIVVAELGAAARPSSPPWSRPSA